MDIFKKVCEFTLLAGLLIICVISLAILDDVCKDVDKLNSQVKFLEAKLNE